MVIFNATLNQMIVLFTFMIFGYILGGKNRAPESASNVLSVLLMNIFLPAYILKVFSNNFHMDVIKEKSQFVLLALLILFITYLFSIVLSKLFTKDNFKRDVFTYGFAFPNFGYVGYPVVGAVLGEKMLFNIVVYSIPYSLAIYTVGMYILNPNRKFSLKNVCNPSIIAMFIGICLGVLNFKIPQVANDIMTMASNCMAPSAMILTGFVLAKRPLKQMISEPKMYLASFIRLVFIPAVIGIILYLIKIPKELFIISVISLSMPSGLNNVVFPEAFGGDSTTGAKLALISSALSLITIPIIMSIILNV